MKAWQRWNSAYNILCEANKYVGYQNLLSKID